MSDLERLPANWLSKIDLVPDGYGEPDDPCWVWTGARNKRYGKVRVGYQTKQAHRAVWEFLHGPIADDLELDHLCLERLCVNPDHLEPVTREENMHRWHDLRRQLIVAYDDAH